MLAIVDRSAEILAPGEGVDVYLRRSPLRQQREHVRVEAGLSISEILDECQVEPTRLYVSINGHSIEQRNWARVRVKPGAHVSIVKVPGKGMLKSILGIVIALAAAIFAPMLLPAALSGTVAGTALTGLIGAGISIAGSLILNALFPTAKNNIATDNTTPLYSIGGAQNQSVQYGGIPEILGVHRVSPPYAAGSYTEISGDDQYLRMLFCVGYGPIQISELQIAETAIETFDEVTFNIIPDHTTQDLTLYTKPVFEESASVLLDSGSGWVERTTAENVDEISVDVSFPNGVYRYQKSDGNRVNYTVVIEAQYAVADSGSWVSLGTITLTAASSQAVRRSLSQTVTRGQYDIRLRKSSADYSGDDTVSENAYLTAVRGRRNVPVIKFEKPLTLIELRIKATNELNGTVNQLNCIASPMIRSWNGSAWIAGQVTRNPADHFRQVLQGNANERPVGDESIDIESIQDWHAYCVANGFTFDMVCSEQKSVYDRLTEIAAAGRASVTFLDGKWGVVWDVAGTDIVQHFTPRNSSNFSSMRAYADLPHGFRVAFINKKNGYLNDERVVYDDGYTEENSTKFEGLEFPGVTDSDLIWKHGRYHIAQLRLQRETYTLTTDFEHLVCTRGDRVRVNHDVVLWGLGAARVKAVSSGPDTVVLDDTLTTEPGKTYSIRFRLPTGATLVRTISGVDSSGTVISLAGADSLPLVGDLAMFGENGFESVVLRVKSITAQKDLSAQLELVDDAPAILEADKGEIPAFETGIAPIVDYRAYPPTFLTTVESIWTKVPPTSEIELSWVAPEIAPVRNYIVQYAAKGTPNWSLPFTTSVPNYDLRGLPPGAYDVTVRAVFNNDQLSGPLRAVVTAAIFAGTPADVASFRVSIAGDTATLQWDDPQDEMVSHFELRFSPLTSGVTWQTSSQLRTNIVGNSVQVAAMVGTYLIKAVGYGGIVSANPAIVASTVDPLTSFNAVEAMQDAPDFLGDKTDVSVSSGQLRLESGGDVFDVADFFEPADFFLSGGGFPSEGIYEFANVIDLGQVYTSRVSAEVVAFGELTSEDVFARSDWFGPPEFFGTASDSLWDVTVEISTTNDDPSGSPVWGAWAELVTADVAARGYRFRAKLQSLQFDVTPVVTGLAVTVDMPDRVIAENDLIVPITGLTIAFAPPYFALSGVSISAQGLQTGDYYEITGKDSVGFNIIFRNAAGTAVQRTFDYVAKGYGSIQ